MGKIEMIAGDFGRDTYELPEDRYGMIELRKEYSLTKVDLTILIERVELHSEESIKKVLGTAGWGIAGGLLLGPLGAIGGMLIGGRTKKVCFAAYLKDGRKFMATTDSKTYQRLAAKAF
jgi:hypothetical protein